MHVHIEARGVGSELELQPGTWTIGGAEDDGVRFPGLPPRLLELDIETEQTWVRCARPLRVGHAVLESNVRRWLLPGEAVRLSRVAEIRITPTAEAAGTMALVRSLLQRGEPPVASVTPALVCVAGPDAGTVFLLGESIVELGRAPECAIRLADGAVSRRHLELLVDPAGTHRVRDVGSSNRTRCNGRWLRSSRLLTDGDLLAVGRSLLHYRRSDGGTDASIGDERGRTAEPVSASATGLLVPPAAASDGGAG